MGHFGTKNGSKTHFFWQNNPTPFGILKQVFLAHFEPVVSPIEPWTITKCFENGSYRHQEGSKVGQKRVFPKVIPD